MDYTIIFIPCRDMAEAKKIGELLLRARLIACANYSSIESCYWWQDTLEETEEVVIFAKTRQDLFDQIAEETKKAHSYETPCIAAMPLLRLNEAYERWLNEQIVRP